MDLTRKLVTEDPGGTGATWQGQDVQKRCSLKKFFRTWMWLEMAFRSLLFTEFGVARGGSALQYDIQTYVLMIMFRPNSAPCMKYLDRPISGIRRRAAKTTV